MKKILTALGLAAFLAAGLGSAAQAADDAFVAWLKSPEHFKLAKKYFALFRNHVPSTCEDYSVVSKPEVVRFGNPVFAEVAKNGSPPMEGQWNERYTVKYCGKEQFQNLMFFAIKDKGLAATVLLPGRTLVTMSNQSEAAVAAAVVGQNRVEKAGGGGCDPLITRVIDTDVVTAPQKVEKPVKGLFWEETWSIEHCGKTVDVRMAFGPNPKGGQRFEALGD